jgi:hypothetical protein
MPIELPPIRSPPPALYRPTIKEEGNGTDEHRNAATSFGLGFPENPILVDLDGEDGYTESEPGSAQHPILIEDRNDTPQHLRVTEDPALELGRPCFAGRTH